MNKPASKTVRIEVFRPGTFTPMQGQSITYSAADLRTVADVYDKETAPAPVVVGHPTTDAPAYAWAESFEYDNTGQRLYADIGDINPGFAEAVKNGRYKKVSLSFHSPDSSANPAPGTWYPKHIGFLGGAAPAVTGLRNVQFEADDAGVTFVADFSGVPRPRISVPSIRRPILPDPADPILSGREAAFAAREAEFATREAELRQKEQQFVHKDNADFAERLINEGRLLPVHKDRIVSILDTASTSPTVSFAESEQPVPMLEALRSALSEMPKVVSFGAFNLGPDPDFGTARPLTIPDGYTVDPRQNELYQRARHIEREKGVSFSEAVDLAANS